METNDQVNQKRKGENSDLSESQRKAWDLCQSGKNVLICGGAGTGKSFVLHRIVESLRKEKRVSVTSSTGVAASNLNASFPKANLNATTLHSWFRMKLDLVDPKQSIMQVYQKYMMKSICLEKWRWTDVLVIDEISMVSPFTLVRMEEMARLIRKSNQPFGGIQMILCGDFAQLQPVLEKKDELPLELSDLEFCFQLPQWNRWFPLDQTVFLVQNFRQSDDTSFLKLLENVRHGILTMEDEQLLKSRINAKIFSVSKNQSIYQQDQINNSSNNNNNIDLQKSFQDEELLKKQDQLNDKNIMKNESELIDENAESIIDITNSNTQDEKKELSTVMEMKTEKKEEKLMEIHPIEIFPRINQVTEFNEKKMNGLKGDMLEYDRLFQLCNYQFENTKEQNKFFEKIDSCLNCEKVLRLKKGALVMLISNLDCNSGLVNGAQGVIVGFEPPEQFPIVQFYHMKSPLIIKRHSWEFPIHSSFSSSLSHLDIDHMDGSCIREQEMTAFGPSYAEFDFDHGNNYNNKKKNEKPFKKMKNEDKFCGVRFFQVPLKLAFSMTIHKSQSMTLDAVRINLGRGIFSAGQAYTGLSRCKSLSGLSLSAFDPRSIMIHSAVIQFYQKIQGGSFNKSLSVTKDEKFILAALKKEKKGKTDL